MVLDLAEYAGSGPDEKKLWLLLLLSMIGCGKVGESETILVSVQSSMVSVHSGSRI